jgi:hypothetical protein
MKDLLFRLGSRQVKELFARSQRLLLAIPSPDYDCDLGQYARDVLSEYEPYVTSVRGKMMTVYMPGGSTGAEAILGVLAKPSSSPSHSQVAIVVECLIVTLEPPTPARGRLGPMWPSRIFRRGVELTTRPDSTSDEGK